MQYFLLQIVKRAETWAKDLALNNMYYPKTLYMYFFFNAGVVTVVTLKCQTFHVCKCHNFFQAVGRIISWALGLSLNSGELLSV